MRIIRIVIALLILLPLLLLLHPRTRATLRLTSGFTPLHRDERVYYEDGAETIAEWIAAALPGAIARVEAYQGLPLKPGFRVYVCASHESFTRHIGQPPSDPVRGITFLRDIWISPAAFSFFGQDTHRQSIMHELSHLHLNQHLGWWRRITGVPSWYQEGLADWVADTGAEIVTRREAMEALRYGYHFDPEVTGRLNILETPLEFGLTWPMFHRQSRMFVEYLLARDEAAFTALLASVLRGENFGDSFTISYGADLESVWNDFIDRLEIED